LITSRWIRIEPSVVFCGYLKTFVLSVVLNIMVDKGSLLSCGPSTTGGRVDDRNIPHLVRYHGV